MELVSLYLNIDFIADILVLSLSPDAGRLQPFSLVILKLLGFREKVFAIIGVKVYAAGLYINPSIFSKLDAWKGRSSEESQKDSSLFDAIYQGNNQSSQDVI